VDATNSQRRIVVYLNDLIFETKIRSTAQHFGVETAIVRSASDLSAELNRVHPELVIIDLNAAGESARSLIQTAKSSSPSARVIAFVSHVDSALAEVAQAAGADEVLPRSRFTQRLPQLLSGVAGHPPAA